PTWFDGRLYVGGAPAMSALDATTGDTIWQHDESLGYGDFFPSTYSAPAVNEDVAVFTSKFGIFAYDPIGGQELWKVSSSSRVHRSAAVVDSVVYTAGPGWFVQRLRAYDALNGTLLLEGDQSLYESTSAPVVGPGPGGVGNRVLVAYGGNENPGSPPTNHGRLQSYLPPAVSADWNRYLGDVVCTSLPYKRHITSINSTPAWAGNHVYFGADDGILYCVDPATGAIVWSHDLGVPIRSSPAVAGNMLFVNGSDGTLYAFVSTFIEALDAGGGGAGPALRTRLVGNAPNPFNPFTTIRFDLGPADGQRQPVSLRIYDVGGRLVRVLVNARRESGHHTVVWDGRNDQGREVASAVYFYRLEAGDQTFSRKLVLAR
ncbi:MAG: PQQ-binding-like beta-propeller repeat protein, partial [Candidatus Eiseniibacteriota bacterium]